MGRQRIRPRTMIAPPLSQFSDIHTHHRTAPDIITSVEPDEGIAGEYGQAWYSVGIHPWSTAEPVADSTWKALEALAADPRVVAIGEAGLDKKHGGSSDYQEEVFLRHVRLSESLSKPLIIHCVGRYGRLMELHGELHPAQLWIVHGFSGKPELARQLVAEGFAISLGHRANPGVAALIPPGRLFLETD